jgi:hypothetical protein
MPEHSALAATAAAHNYQSFATMNVEGDIVEDGPITECPDEAVYLNDCGVSGHDQNDERLRQVKSLNR